LDDDGNPIILDEEKNETTENETTENKTEKSEPEPDKIPKDQSEAPAESK